MKQRGGKIRPMLLIAGFSFLLLLFVSQSSPLYPLNTWDDANCLLTVGRVMKNGGVLYRDIYEQKGPTLYFFHLLAACISETRFLGVFLLEVAALTAFLLACRHACRSSWFSCLLCAVLGTAVCLGKAFSMGDSAEEFCLPFLAWGLVLYLSDQESRGRFFLMGLMAGIVGTIKYTMLGVFLGLFLAEAVTACRSRERRRFVNLAFFLCGMAVPVLAWLSYFLVHHAVWEAFEAYIYNNLFLYAGEGRTGWLDAARMVRDNLPMFLFLGLGLVLFLTDSARPGRKRAAVAAAFLIQTLAIFLPGRVWPYSLLALTGFGCIGTAGISRLPVRESRLRTGICTAAVMGLCLCSAWAFTGNAYLRGVPLEKTAQGKLAKKIEAGSSFLQYSHLDDGLYLLTGTLPENRFFVRLNVRYPEMESELDRYLTEGIPDYVLITWRTLPEQFDRYRLVAETTGYDENGRINKPFYLYRRE